MADAEHTVAFQGEVGANSDLACREVFPDKESLPCHAFVDAFAAVRDGIANYALIPIDNSVAGRVADIHHLLPESELHIIGEHFQAVHHHLLVVPGTNLEALTHVHSHVHALSQCRNIIRELGVEAVVHADTAGAAADISRNRDTSHAAIASELAGQIYGLESLKSNIEDAEHNTTRFLIMSGNRVEAGPDDGPTMTSFIFRVRNVPAALYKALGGFATNGVNITKLESYLVGGGFVAAQFYAEIDGHPSHRSVELALEELAFYSHEVRIIGVYPQNPFRLEAAHNGGA